MKRSAYSKKPKRNRRHIVAFMIGVSLIGLMIFQVLSAVSDAEAHKGRGRICRAGGRGSWFSFCKTGNANSCGEGCTCTPFSKKMKWGVCRGGGTKPSPSPVPCVDKPSSDDRDDDVMIKGPEDNDKKDTKGRKPCNPTAAPSVSPGTTISPAPTSGPPGGGACGATCSADNDCASGFCNPVGFPLCPTSEPGMPIEDCQFYPIDPTTQNVCAPATCRTNNTSDQCACTIR